MKSMQYIDSIANMCECILWKCPSNQNRRQKKTWLLYLCIWSMQYSIWLQNQWRWSNLNICDTKPLFISLFEKYLCDWSETTTTLTRIVNFNFFFLTMIKIDHEDYVARVQQTMLTYYNIEITRWINGETKKPYQTQLKTKIDRQTIRENNWEYG